MIDAPRRILIVRLSAIGDVVRAMPAMEALRRAYPHSHIAWLVEELSAPLLESHPMLDAVYVWDRSKLRAALKRPWRWGEAVGRLLALGIELRRRPYDLAIDFQSLVKSGIWTRASGAIVRQGFAREYCREPLNALFTNRKIDPHSHRLPRVQRNLALIANLIPPESQAPRVAWNEDTEAAAWADNVLATYGGKAPVLLHPGTSRVDKFWWPSCWAAVGDALREELAAPILVTWGPGEQRHAEAVVEHMWGDGTVAPETRTLHQMAALVRRARLLVSVDNGMMHLAALTDTPIVGLFGPRDVEINQPASPRMRCVCEHGIFAPGEAMPEFGGAMQGIRVAAVLEAARSLVHS